MNYANSAQSSYARETASAAAQHPIPAAIDSLGYTINDLAAVADLVQHRLDRVLMPHQSLKQVEGAALKAASPVASAMVGEVEAQRQRIAIITAGLQDVLNRLEV